MFTVTPGLLNLKALLISIFLVSAMLDLSICVGITYSESFNLKAQAYKKITTLLHLM